ncbi:MAG: hypothetical protein M1830_001273 [Pleopsidium flavum]|nr:MAG: hypothetical protein M1830_001273 [Pleopsidium flavum]
MARRGGVKRISGQIYDEMRGAMKTFLQGIVSDCCIYLDHRDGKTVTVTDVIFALKRRGRPIYGFDKDTFNPKKKLR